MSKWVSNNGKYKDTSKEDRARECNNVMCPKCKYQNHYVYIRKFGTCHLCGNTLSHDYFKKRLRTKLNSGV